MNGGATIGGVSFASLGLTLLKANVPLLPEVRQYEEEIPGMDGLLDLGTEYGPRPIELDVEFSADNETEYQTRLSNIAKVFNPKRGAQPLVLDRMLGKMYYVKYNGTISIEKIATLGTFTIPLKAFDPFAYSVTDTTVPLALGQGYSLGMGLRLGDAYSFTVKASPTVLKVYHAGNHEAKPLIRLTGTGSNITIANDTTQEAFSVNLTLKSTDVLEIDCAKSKIRLNGQNAFYAFSGLFPKLAEGENSFTITATSPNLTVAFVFRHTYLY